MPPDQTSRVDLWSHVGVEEDPFGEDSERKPETRGRDLSCSINSVQIFHVTPRLT